MSHRTQYFLVLYYSFYLLLSSRALSVIYLLSVKLIYVSYLYRSEISPSLSCLSHWSYSSATLLYFSSCLPRIRREKLQCLFFFTAAQFTLLIFLAELVHALLGRRILCADNSVNRSRTFQLTVLSQLTQWYRRVSYITFCFFVYLLTRLMSISIIGQTLVDGNSSGSKRKAVVSPSPSDSDM